MNLNVSMSGNFWFNRSGRTRMPLVALADGRISAKNMIWVLGKVCLKRFCRYLDT